MIDNEQVESVQDVNTEGASPQAEDTSTESNTTSQEASAAGSSDTASEKYVPYERFKELVEQKNQFSRQFEETQRALQELRSKVETPKSTEPSPQQKLAQRLKEIDPEFGGTFEQLMQAQEELKAWKAQQEQERQAQAQQAQAKEAFSTLDRMQTELKASKTDHERYVAQIIRMGQLDPNLGVKDIPTLYKNLHEAQAKEREEFRRQILAEYASTKSTDSKVPAPGKGASPKAAGKQAYSADPDEAKSQIIKRVMEGFQRHKAG